MHEGAQCVHAIRCDVQARYRLQAPAAPPAMWAPPVRRVSQVGGLSHPCMKCFSDNHAQRKRANACDVLSCLSTSLLAGASGSTGDVGATGQTGVTGGWTLSFLYEASSGAMHEGAQCVHAICCDVQARYCLQAPAAPPAMWAPPVRRVSQVGGLSHPCMK